MPNTSHVSNYKGIMKFHVACIRIANGIQFSQFPCPYLNHLTSELNAAFVVFKQYSSCSSTIIFIGNDPPLSLKNQKFVNNAGEGGTRNLIRPPFCLLLHRQGCLHFWWINLGFWETAHLPLPRANISTYFLLNRAKWWLRGGVGGQFP